MSTAEATALLKTITPLIAAEVARQISQRPPRDGRDGRDGKSVKGEKGEPGPPIDMRVVSALVTEAVELQVAQIPVPRNGIDGIDGKDGLNGKDAMPLVPAVAYFDKDAVNDETVLVRVIAQGAEIHITPKRNASGIESARIERVA